jgi:uncharacterized protein (TIGR03118 family)
MPATTLSHSIRLLPALPVLGLMGVLSVGASAQTNAYVQTNLISDGAVPAKQTDPTLINPWGVSIGTDLWIDTAGSGFSEVEDSTAATKTFAVTVPPATSAAPHGTPAGTVSNPDTSLFMIPNSGSATFLFGTLDGSIAAWNASTPQAVTVVNNSSAKAAYTDIALDTNATGTFLLAANFAAGTVDVFDSTFKSAKLAGGFSDPNIPKGYSPFGIHSIGKNVYVTYAEPDPTTGRETVGAGLGYIDLFDDNGNLIQRAISQGNLNAPWGMALAPASFGGFGGDLLVGNFGDGVINVYDPTHFSLLGQIQDASGNPIANLGLWELIFGQNGVGDPNTLYISAGINNEKDGVFAAIAATSVTAKADFSFTAQLGALTVSAGQSGTDMLTLTGSNGFSGAVSLSCSGLPSGTACSFTPATVNLSGTTAATVALSIATTATSPSPYMPASLVRAVPSRTGMVLAFAGPLGLIGLAGLRRRSISARGALFVLALALLSLGVSGCGGYSGTPAATQPPASTPTPAPAPAVSQVIVNATAGAITHSVNLTLTVQ